METKNNLKNAYLRELALALALLYLKIGVIDRTTYEQIRNTIKQKNNGIEYIFRVLRYKAHALQFLLKNLTFLVQEEIKTRLFLLQYENKYNALISKSTDAIIEKRIDGIQARQHQSNEADYVNAFKDTITLGVTSNNHIRKAEETQEQSMRGLLNEMKISSELKEQLFELLTKTAVKQYGLKHIQKQPYAGKHHLEKVKINVKSA